MSQKQTLEGSKFDTTPHPRLNIPFLDLSFDLWLAIWQNRAREAFRAGDDLTSEDVGIGKVIKFFGVLVSEP
jgi:hypothetical protein